MSLLAPLTALYSDSAARNVYNHLPVMSRVVGVTAVLSCAALIVWILRKK